MNLFTDTFRYLRIYRRYIGRRLYVVFVLAALTALAEGLGIALLLPLLEASETGGQGSMGGKAEFMFDLLSWIGISGSMVGILAFIAVVFLLKGALTFANGAYQGYLQAQLMRELKSGMFDAYSAMDYRLYIERNTGHFINVINGQINLFFQSFLNFTAFLSQVITTVSYFTIAFALTWRFSLMALGVGIGVLFLFKYLNEYVRRLSRRTSREMSHLNKLLMQALQSFKYIASTNQMAHLRSGVMSSIRRLTGYTFRQRVAGAFTGAVREPVSIVFIVVVIAVQVAVMEQPVAPIFVAILLFHRGMQSMISVQSGWQQIMNKIGAVEMVDDEFAEVGGRREPNGSHVLEGLDHGIEFRDVCFAYDGSDSAEANEHTGANGLAKANGREDEATVASPSDVLHDVSLTIPANTTVAFVGESGAGKSTLIDMLTLLLKPRRGEIRIDGVPGSEVDLSSWRSQIGYVSQETVVFDDTIANNISLWGGDYEDDEKLDERIRHAAEQAYAADFIEDLPDGYQTVVGDRGVRLSGGQRQRLFVARELFKRPNLLILDEATSALDTESERYIQKSIDALKGQVTVVIIAHRLSTIKNVDYLYVMDEGRITEQGTYDELTSQTGTRFHAMVEMQSL